MSDQDAPPDPIDKAYTEAEAVLDDEAARAARRARVLAAVAAEQAAPAVAPAVSKRSSWPRAGWLAAASVAGLSALVALQIERTGVIEQPPRPTRPEAPTAVAPPAIAPPAAAPQALEAARDAQAVSPRAVAPSAPTRPAAAAPPSAPQARAIVQAPTVAAAPPPSAAPAAEASSSDDTGEVVVTSSRSAAPARSAEFERGQKLRNAAAAGRTAELTGLLAAGVAVDAADDDGETALMKAVQANQPAAAALLLRRGASLERKNEGDVSARDMAAEISDPELNRALGLEP